MVKYENATLIKVLVMLEINKDYMMKTYEGDLNQRAEFAKRSCNHYCMASIEKN